MDENRCPQCGGILGLRVECPMCMKYLVIEGASLITPEDVRDSREKGEEWLRGRGRDVSTDLVSHVRILYQMICDHLSGARTDFSGRIVSLAAFGLLYVSNPVDLLPDPIDGVGYVDDRRVMHWVEAAMGDVWTEYCQAKGLPPQVLP